MVTSGVLYLKGGWRGVIIDGSDLKPDHHLVIGVFEIGPVFMNFAHAASNWSMVGLCIFRNIGVFWPLYYQSKIASQAIYVDLTIVLVYVLSMMMIVPQAMTLEINKEGIIVTKSDGGEEAAKKLAGMSITTIVLADLIPLILNFVLLIPLLGKMLKSSAIQRSASNATQQSAEKRQAAITLTAITFFYIICLSPKIALLLIRLIDGAWYICALCWEDRIRLFVFTEVLQTANYSGNFFFYILLNRRMRKKILTVLKLEGKVHHEPNATETERLSIRSRKQPPLTSTTLIDSSRSFPAIMESRFEDVRESQSDSTKSDINRDESLPLIQTNNSSANSPEEPSESSAHLNINNSCNEKLADYSTPRYKFKINEPHGDEESCKSSTETADYQKNESMYNSIVAIASIDTMKDIDSPVVPI